jgi:hypothetical protein
MADGLNKGKLPPYSGRPSENHFSDALPIFKLR